MKMRINSGACLTVLLATGKLYAHHYEIGGMSIHHSMMSLPATIVAALGAMFFFGWRLRQKKVLGVGFLLASLPMWVMAFDLE